MLTNTDPYDSRPLMDQPIPKITDEQRAAARRYVIACGQPEEVLEMLGIL